MHIFADEEFSGTRVKIRLRLHAITEAWWMCEIGLTLNYSSFDRLDGRKKQTILHEQSEVGRTPSYASAQVCMHGLLENSTDKDGPRPVRFTHKFNEIHTILKYNLCVPGRYGGY